jgi:hypothetical protein
LAVRVTTTREDDMSQRLPDGLAWTLLGLTVVLLAAAVVLGLTGGEAWSLVFGFIPVTLSFALVGALIAVRAGQEQRQQLKWFVYASAVSALVVAAAAFGSKNPLPEFEIIVPLIPVAVGVAIFKYRPYDIDQLISRTLAYLVVTGLLIGAYGGWSSWPGCSGSLRRRPWPSRRWPRRRCSARCGGGCSVWWTRGSTGSAMTRS